MRRLPPKLFTLGFLIIGLTLLTAGTGRGQVGSPRVVNTTKYLQVLNVTRGDAVYSSLRLWRDANHDGVSQPEELQTLQSLDVARLQLDYKESKREDEFGNRFRCRAKMDDAKGGKVNRRAWGVFLLAGQ
jgi:hypothetical protein